MKPMAHWSTSTAIRDDRGSERRVETDIPPRQVWYWAMGRSFKEFDPSDGTTDAQRSMTIQRRLLKGAQPFWHHGDLLKAILLLGVIPLVGAVVLALLGQPPALALSLAGVTAAFLGVPILCHRGEGVRDRHLIASLPPACVVCGYDLTGMAAEGDGCTVCPECGGAWRLPLFGSS